MTTCTGIEVSETEYESTYDALPGWTIVERRAHLRRAGAAWGRVAEVRVERRGEVVAQWSWGVEGGTGWHTAPDQTPSLPGDDDFAHDLGAARRDAQKWASAV
jgi:hypothetical protein